MGSVSGLLSSFGGGAGKLAALASLAGGLEKLGLDSGMIGKFVPIVISFIRDRGGENVAASLGRYWPVSDADVRHSLIGGQC